MTWRCVLATAVAVLVVSTGRVPDVKADAACVLVPEGAIAWWRFEEDLVDSVDGHDGAAGTTSGVGFDAGVVGDALDLNGSNQYVRVADAASLDTPDGVTLEGWIYPVSRSGPRVIASKWSDGTGQRSWIFKLHNNGTGRLRLETRSGSGGGDLQGATVIPLNDWTHVAATYDTTTASLKLYVNGVLDASGSSSGTAGLANNSAEVEIGSVNGGGERFDGGIDELTVYDRALSGTEIDAIHDAGSAGKCFDTTPPVVTCPDDMVVEATGPSGATATFSVSATDDVDGSLAISCSVASGSTFPLGETTVECSATDASGNTGSCSFTVTVQDTTCPTITSISATPGSLWPPNNKMRSVTISVTATDAVSTVTSSIVSVASDEDQGNDADWQVTGTLTVDLRAQRDGSGDGRVYTIAVRSTDVAGNACDTDVTVTVPHDQGK